MIERPRLIAAALVVLAVLATAGEATAARAPRLASVRVTGGAPTSVSVIWRQPHSGRARIELYVNGRRIAMVRGRRFTFATLACATSYRLTLRARNPSGRRSGRTRLFGTPRARAAARPGLFVTAGAGAAADPGDQDKGEQPPPIPQPVVPSPAAAPTNLDRQAPTAPGGLSTGKITDTTIPLSWKASTDNVGIARYAVYLNGAQTLPPSPTATSYTFTGLTCATSYTLAVQAFDPSGNASSMATKPAKPAACPPPPAPPAPPQGSCPSNPLQGLQRPGQQTVLDPGNPCRTVTGRIASHHIEHDGDCHINLTLDAPYKGLLNGVNQSAANGNIITEVIPSHSMAIPTVGSHVTITGTWTNDHATGWNELHAIWTMSVQSGGN